MMTAMSRWQEVVESYLHRYFETKLRRYMKKKKKKKIHESMSCKSTYWKMLGVEEKPESACMVVLESPVETENP